jgi:signal transduction histidine kinase
MPGALPSTIAGEGHGGRKTIAVAVGAVLAVTFLAIALLFANAFGAARVAENARHLHWTNAALGATSIARASNAQALVFGVDLSLGVASEEAAAGALAEARENLEALESWIDPEIVPPAVPTAAMRSLDEVAAVGKRVLAQLGRGEVEAAAQTMQEDFEAAYQRVTVVLGREQATVIEAIDETENIAGLVSGFTRLLITLLIPIVALVSYRFLVKRQALRRELSLQAKLEAERELSAAKDEFIAGVSHELRTPLTSIYGFSEVLVVNGLVDPEQSMELVGLINAESMELSRMVEDLLTAARLDAGAIEYATQEFPIADEIDSVVAPHIRAGADIRLEVSPRIVAADAGRARQVLRNLVSNAIRHGGPVITVRGYSGEDGYSISVADNGPGIPREVEERMFNRFVHTGDETLLAGSVGLGLAIARELSEGMGGSLTYHRFGEETRFVMTVPLAESHPPDGPEIPEHGAVGSALDVGVAPEPAVPRDP